MLNLGIINSGGSYQDVSLEEVQASQLAYMEAEQHLTDYMNYVEVLEGLQRHSSNECLAFASELLGIPASDIRGVSKEEYEQHISMESAGIWATFKKLWDDFVSWIRGLWRRMINFFKSEEGKKEEAAAKASGGTANATSTDTGSKYKVVEKPVTINGNASKKAAPAAPQKQYNKFSSKPNTSAYKPVGKPTYKMVAEHTEASLNSLKDACGKTATELRRWSSKGVAANMTMDSTKALMRELSRFGKEHAANGLSGAGMTTYIRALDGTLRELDGLVRLAYNIETKDFRGNANAVVAKATQAIRTAGSKFITIVTREFNYAKRKQAGLTTATNVANT